MHFKGTLEVNAERGVVYFHSEDGGPILRIEGLPKPVQDPLEKQIDIRLAAAKTQQPNDKWNEESDRASGVIRAFIPTTLEEVRRSLQEYFANKAYERSQEGSR